MLLTNTRNCKKLKDQKGISIIEYIIALLIVTVGIVSWLQLTSAGVQSGTHVEKLAGTKNLATGKASELIKNVDTIFVGLSENMTKIGSIAPSAPVANYSDQLDFLGNPISTNNANSNNSIPKYLRQWLVLRNYPNDGDITIFVSVIYKDTNQILRLAKAVKSDGTITVSSTRTNVPNR